MEKKDKSYNAEITTLTITLFTLTILLLVGLVILECVYY